MKIKTWWERLSCERHIGANFGEKVTRDEEIAELRTAIKRQEQEVLKLHRDLAAEKLRADQGWHRYESANSRKNELESEYAGWAQEIAALKSTAPAVAWSVIDAARKSLLLIKVIAPEYNHWNRQDQITWEQGYAKAIEDAVRLLVKTNN